MGTDPPQDSGKQISVMGFRLDIWQVLMCVLMVIHGFFILFTFREYGVNPDEAAHIDYGRSIVLWYQSLFQIRGIFSRANIWLYGGLYDTLVHLITRISPIGLHDTRHLCNALVGMAGVLGAYKIGGLYGKRWIGLLAALFLILTPRYYGHSFINHKDIPFAAAFLWSTFFLIKATGDLPKLSNRSIWTLGISIGIALGIRVGGVLLLAYLCLFFAIRHIQVLYTAGMLRSMAAWLSSGTILLRRITYVSLISYATMLLFWPWAQLNPIGRPLRALLKFSSFSYDIRTFFEGVYYRSTQAPWYYAPKWILLTLPDFLLLSLAAGALHLAWKWKSFDAGNLLTLQKGMLAFAAIFPVGIVMVSGTPLCNGIRHLLFAIILLSVLGAILISEFILSTKSRKITVMILASALSLSLLEMVNLHPNQYIYFNRLFAGGVAHASTLYETDYYQHSFKQGINWINNVYSGENPPPVKVSGISSDQWYMVDQNKFVLVSEPWQADLHLANTHSETHRNFPGEVLSRVVSGGAELLYIIRPDSSYLQDHLFSESVSPYRYSHLARIFESTGRFNEALVAYQISLHLDPGDAATYNGIGELLFAVKEYDMAAQSFESAANLKPDLAPYQANLAKCYQDMEKYPEALFHYDAAIKISPDYLFALHNRARLLFAIEEFSRAEAAYEDLLGKFPSYSEGFLDYGNLEYQQGNLDDAVSRYRTALDQNPNLVLAYNRLGIALSVQGKHKEALDSFSNGIRISPEHPDLNFNSANLQYKLGHYSEALENYEVTKRTDPGIPNLDYNLALTYFKLDRWSESVTAMGKVVAKQPGNPHAWYTLARSFRALERLSDSNLALRRAIELDVSNQSYWSELTSLGAAYQNSGQKEIAREIYLEAIKAIPANLNAHFNLGIMYIDSGEYESAKRSFTLAAKLSPGEHQVHLALARINRKLGLVADAVLEYRQVLHLYPDHALAKRELESMKPDSQVTAP
jgi:tetratricopeptide (TPR) repeat protein